MKTEKKIIVLAILGFFVIPICTGIISCYYFSKASSKPVEIRKKLDVKDDSIIGTNTLSVYLETEEGSGEYRLSEEDVFLHDGYYFNEEKSKCENGGTLSYDKTTGNIRMSTTASDRCFVYFDKGTPSLGNFADYIKSLYTTQGANGLYLHDSTLTNGAGDNSYRYAGASDSVNNFVCFGTDAETCPIDNLYRIIGVFGDQVKLIKYDYATKEQLGTDGEYFQETTATPSTTYKGSMTTLSWYRWNYLNESSSTNDWTISRLNKTNLNSNYLNNLGSTWTDKIAITTWNVGGMSYANGAETNAKIAYDYELGANKINKTYDAKIGLMYVSEYYYSASPENWLKVGNNWSSTDYRSAVDQTWLYMGESEWTISPNTDSSNFAFLLLGPGNVYYAGGTYGYNFLRPTFSLAPSVELLGGSGRKTDPMRIR